MNAPPWEVIASGIQATLSMDILPFSPFPWGFIAEKAIICYEISFWSIWASVSAMSPHNLLPFLSRFALKAEWREGFDAVLELFSNSQNTVYYLCCFKHTCKTQHHMDCYEGSEFHPRQTQHKSGEHQFLSGYKLLSGKKSSD